MLREFRKDKCVQCGQSTHVVNGWWLRVQRESAGISLRSMARRMNLSAAYVSDIERNRRGCPSEVERAYRSIGMRG